MNLNKRFENLRKRRIDPTLSDVKLDEALTKTANQGILPYVLSAMQPIDLRSTNRLVEQADRVYNQLEKNLPEFGYDVDKDYQGSVMNNTHIRYYSDIDLLTPTREFHYCRLPLKPSSPWLGDAIKELKGTRLSSDKVVDREFPKATVDTSGSKSTSAEGGSLKGKVDIVTCAWLNTVEWDKTRNKIHRGISILDRDKGVTIDNFPFMHNYLIEEKRKSTFGNSNKLIRFLKTVVADLEDEYVEIEVNSYDICALVYNMDTYSLYCSEGGELILLENFVSFADKLEANREFAKTLKVPNRTRDLFDSNEGLSFSELRKLRNAIQAIYDEAIFGSSILGNINDRIARDYYRVING